MRKKAEGLLEEFIKAGQELVKMGADGLSTTCGFLSLFQEQLTESVGVPVASSSLMQVAMVNALLPPGKRAGIITITKQHLTPEHLAAARVPEGTPIAGTEKGREFSRVILDDESRFDPQLARLDLLDAGKALCEENPDIGAIVLECTNMAPYAPALHQSLGVPVYSIYSFVSWFQSGLSPRPFGL